MKSLLNVLDLNSKRCFLTLSDRILTFLSENPSGTPRVIANALGASRASVRTYLTKMFVSGTVSRSKKMPFTYSLPDPSTAEVLPSSAFTPTRSGTRLADEQRILSVLASVLAQEKANDRKALLDVLGWAPHRLEQTLDRLHSAGLVRTVHGSYVLIPRSL